MKTSTHSIIKVFNSELREAEPDEDLLRVLRYFIKLIKLLLVGEKVLQISVGKCTEETVAVRPCSSYRFVFSGKIFDFKEVHRVLVVFLF